MLLSPLVLSVCDTAFLSVIRRRDHRTTYMDTDYFALSFFLSHIGVFHKYSLSFSFFCVNITPLLHDLKVFLFSVIDIY